MNSVEKLKEVYRQYETTKTPSKKYQLRKAIYRLEKKIKLEKIGMKVKDGIAYK